MVAYVVARIRVEDAARYQDYVAATPAVIARFGGRFLARGGTTVALEGPAVSERVVILEFPSVERAQAFFHSPEYQAVRRLRLDCAEASLFIVDGVPA